MVRKCLTGMLIAYLLFAAGWVLSAGIIRGNGDLELLHVACDPTRELWHDINQRFITDYAQKTGQTLNIRMSHGGSGSQARAVIDGLDADITSLALWNDTDAIRKAGLMVQDWDQRWPNRSLPYTSTIVFVVRKGNPKQIHDWCDLTQPGVKVITPNPKTSGNGKWSFLAIWGSVIWQGGTEAEARERTKQVFMRVPVMDAGARGSTMTFAQKGIGDVHLTWENEAHLEVQESRGALEIVYPRVSVFAEPHVALVDRNIDRKESRAMAEAYLEFLYTEPAQEVIARHFHRPIHPTVMARHRVVFPEMDLRQAVTLVPTQRWDDLQERFFAEHGVFDQIYLEGRR